MSALMVAAFGGNWGPVRALIAKHANVNAQDNQGRTALMAAVSNGEVAVVNALLDAGAKMDAADANGGVALTYAAAAGSADAIEALHKRGAKPTANDLVLATSSCATPAVRALLAAGVGADAAAGGRTALLAAAGENCAEAVTLLLDRGANINATDGDGWTPLIKATAGGFIEVVRVLLQRGADMDVADKLERTAWMYAATRGKEDIAALFEAEKARRKK
jgi:ankyrin repeat protein